MAVGEGIGGVGQGKVGIEVKRIFIESAFVKGEVGIDGDPAAVDIGPAV